MNARAVTTRIDHLHPDIRQRLDPVQVGARSGLLWRGHGRTLAGVGHYRRIPLRRPGGFGEAQAALAALAPGPGSGDRDRSDGGRGEGRPGSGPVAFASLDFDPSSDGELIVPEIVIGTAPNGRQWITTIVEGPSAGSRTESGYAEALVRDAAARLDALDADLAALGGVEPTELRLASTLAPEEWRDEIVTAARTLIREGRLDKCVLARELTVAVAAPEDGCFDPAVIVRRLDQTFPTANLFLVDGFIGASPELLVARLGDMVMAHPLAGTLPRSTDPDRDRTLAAELMSSTKNRWEHQITIDWLLDNLLPFCSYVDAEPEPSIVSLANVHHLGTKVEGRLSAPAAPILELVDALHPTPAVGGDPQKAALDLIDELERADRGRYGGPTGWVDGRGNGEFAVSVRSARFESRDRVRLFAGVGVVGDSDPQAELDETRAKFQAMLGALIRP